MSIVKKGVGDSETELPRAQPGTARRRLERIIEAATHHDLRDKLALLKPQSERRGLVLLE